MTLAYRPQLVAEQPIFARLQLLLVRVLLAGTSAQQWNEERAWDGRGDFAADLDLASFPSCAALAIAGSTRNQIAPSCLPPRQQMPVI